MGFCVRHYSYAEIVTFPLFDLIKSINEYTNKLSGHFRHTITNKTILLTIQKYFKMTLIRAQ